MKTWKASFFHWAAIAARRRNLVVSIKDARYNIDPELAAAIII